MYNSLLLYLSIPFQPFPLPTNLINLNQTAFPPALEIDIENVKMPLIRHYHYLWTITAHGYQAPERLASVTTATSSDTSTATTGSRAARQEPARWGGFGDFKPGEISCWFPHFGHGGREIGADGGGEGGAYVLGSAADEP